MTYNAYEVVFIDNTSIEIWAFSAEQAKILAQAENIKKRKDYEVIECKYVGVVTE